MGEEIGVIIREGSEKKFWEGWQHLGVWFMGVCIGLAIMGVGLVFQVLADEVEKRRKKHPGQPEQTGWSAYRLPVVISPAPKPLSRKAKIIYALLWAGFIILFAAVLHQTWMQRQGIVK